MDMSAAVLNPGLRDVLTTQEAFQLLEIIQASIVCRTEREYSRLVGEVDQLAPGIGEHLDKDRIGRNRRRPYSDDLAAKTGSAMPAVGCSSRCYSIADSGSDRKQTFASLSGTGRDYSGRIKLILHHLAPHLEQAFQRTTAGESRGVLDKLSRREREVLQWMAEGKNTWEISRILHISERTVYFHVGNLLEKLGATCRSHAVSIAVREGIGEQP